MFLSVVSAWEISIKSCLGKLPLAQKVDVFIHDMLARHAFSVLPITLGHALAEHDLPSLHKDPFDRLLIAQAQLENFTLVTNDQKIRQYDIQTVW